uniref:SNRNP25 ubiquitin-like domain-containing protein n=1 Tax=Oryza glaberrima TaxID=4538 RepID=I1PQK9_ORYGL
MDPGKSFSAAEEEATDSVSTKPEEVAAYQSSEAKQAKLQSMLAALLDDPILADVPRKPSLADVDTLINLELGSAMRLTVVKLDGTSFGTDVAMLNTATVKDLKMAIRKKTDEIEQEKMGHRHISWFLFFFMAFFQELSDPFTASSDHWKEIPTLVPLNLHIWCLTCWGFEEIRSS